MTMQGFTIANRIEMLAWAIARIREGIQNPETPFWIGKTDETITFRDFESRVGYSPVWYLGELCMTFGYWASFVDPYREPTETERKGLGLVMREFEKKRSTGVCDE